MPLGANSDDPNREPSAAIRGMARASREMYIALVREGFTAKEALTIIGQTIAAAVAVGTQE